MGLFDFLKKKEPVQPVDQQPAGAAVNPVSTYPVNFDNQQPAATTPAEPAVDATQAPVSTPAVTVQAPVDNSQVSTPAPMDNTVAPAPAPVDNFAVPTTAPTDNTVPPVAGSMGTPPMDTTTTTNQQFSDAPVPTPSDNMAPAYNPVPTDMPATPAQAQSYPNTTAPMNDVASTNTDSSLPTMPSQYTPVTPEPAMPDLSTSTTVSAPTQHMNDSMVQGSTSTVGDINTPTAPMVETTPTLDTANAPMSEPAPSMDAPSMDQFSGSTTPVETSNMMDNISVSTPPSVEPTMPEPTSPSSEPMDQPVSPPMPTPTPTDTTSVPSNGAY